MTAARIFTSLIGEELLLYLCDWTKMVTGKKGQKKLEQIPEKTEWQMNWDENKG